MRMVKRLIKGEKGSVLVLTTISMVVLVAFSAGVMDMGQMYQTRRQLQNASDGAALAGAQELLRFDLSVADRQMLAINTALDYAQRNGVSVSQIEPGYPQVICVPLPYNNDCDFSSDYYYNAVKVSAGRYLNLMVAGLLNSAVGDVGASATGIIAPMMPTDGLWPVGVPACYDWNEDGTLDESNECSGPPEGVPVRLKLASPPGSAGNFQPLNWPPSGGGAADYENDFNYGYGDQAGEYIKPGLPWCGDVSYPSPAGYPDCTLVDDPYVSTETGNKAGPTWNSIEYLVQMASGDSNPTNGVDPVAGSQDDPASSWNTSGPGRCTWGGAAKDPLDLPLYGGGASPPPGDWVGNASGCYRVGIIPILAQKWEDLTGNKPVNIVGWGAFYLVGLGDRDTGKWTKGGQVRVWGYYTSLATVTGGRFSSTETGLWGARLWK
ncbi:MAG: Tad domain-containing protein [Dehalococcoidia bacterium]|nr:Tad domain-containing protein [Dehalococcoidia bacterium]